MIGSMRVMPLGVVVGVLELDMSLDDLLHPSLTECAVLPIAAWAHHEFSSH